MALEESAFKREKELHSLLPDRKKHTNQEDQINVKPLRLGFTCYPN